MSTFQCQRCGQSFTVPAAALEKYPTWQPKLCRRCRGPAQGAARIAPKSGPRPDRDASSRRAPPSSGRTGATSEGTLTLQEVLATYTDGPTTGVFTDGAAHPNPGRGGWGAVYVLDNQVIAQEYGSEAETTNNRMELTALIAGYQLVPAGTPAVVMTDSQLCVDTVNTWAAGWEKNGWKRKAGAIKNLDLVQKLYKLAQGRPDIELRWIKSHTGYRWNEYADALATAYRRPTP
jgi:ribonuclease HI